MTSILEFFTFNKTFLSGAIDMVVIKHPDGSLKATPLRVRFGQFKILKAKEKNVQVFVNDKHIDLPMRLSEHGEVYVIHEVKRRERNMSEDFSSSPSEASPLSSPKNSKISMKMDDKIDEVKKIKFNLEVGANNIRETVVNEMSFSIVNTPSTNNIILREEDGGNMNIDNIINTNASSPIPNTNNTNNTTASTNNENSFIFEPPLPKMNLELSNCWDIISKNKKDKNFNFNEHFNKNKISQEVFNKDPWKVINNSNLAIKYENHIYTWKVIAPLILSQLTYNSELPEDVLHSLTQQQNGFLMWKTIQRDAFKIDIEKYEKDPSVKSTPEIKKKKYRKSYSLSTSQLEMMELHPGKNTIKFIVTSSYQGKQELTSDIYLWNYDDKILVSDLDGTVTRSDVIGQIFAFWGKDWSHKRIVKLYNDIEQNGYKILYLTARTMCQHTQTKNYLYSITQDGQQMPSGPILMSPDGLVSSLKREVIDRTPESFKIECLTMVINLFPIDIFPFYCGIGNKKTDAVAYESVGISKHKIYIINERGEISTSNTNYKLTYEQMDEIVNELFPYVNDRGYNSLFFDQRTLTYFEPDRTKLVDDDIEKELKMLLK